MHGRDRRFVTSLLRDRFMPAVVTARNTPDTHNNSAVCLFSEPGMYCDCTSACGVVIGANDHRMEFCLVHNIAK